MRIDLPSTGTYTVRIALGDPGGAPPTLYVLIKDDSSTLLTLNATPGGGDQYLDASGANRTSPADWVSNNVAANLTFSTTIMNIVFGDGGLTYGEVAYLLIDGPTGGGPDFTFIKPWMIA